MFKKYLSNIKIEENLFDYLSERTTGYNGADIKDISNQLIRIIVNKEINDISNYNITIEDCNEIVEKSKTSVSESDVINMNYFIKKHNY